MAKKPPRKPKKESKPGKLNATSRSRKKNEPRKHGRPWKLLLCFWGAVVLALVCTVYWVWSSTFDLNAIKEMPQRSEVFDVDGKVYSRLEGENRVVVPLSKVSKNFVHALLAREDSRFYSHHGIDPVGIARAIVRNVLRASAAQGASTLTQQLARNSYPDRVGQKKSLHRKLLEAALSLRIEKTFSKDEILECYMNRIYFGSGVYGIEGASLAYFGKHASDLTLGEAAMIAGIIRSPTRLSPLNNLKAAKRERDTVIRRMVKEEMISQKEADAVLEAPLVITKKRLMSTQENYIMDAVRRELDLVLSDDQRDDGGLKVFTTIDPVLQKAAEKALDAQLTKVESRPGYSHPRRSQFTQEAKEEEQAPAYLQGALVAIDNRTGGIRALVGGRDFSESKYNRAILPQAARQVGSTFKPFVYAAAYGHGLSPDTEISDGPIQHGEIRGAENWHPENSDGTYKGDMRAEDGLIHSRNTVSVRVGNRAGMDSVLQLAGAAGLQKIPHEPAIYLGSFETTVAQLTAAYTIFANNGVRRQTYLIERIQDSSGEVIYKSAHLNRKVIEPNTALLITSALTKVLERGTAASAKGMGVDYPAAGKTGTTNDFRDAWFVGYTSSLTCGVWVGLDKPQTIMSKGYGAALALPIWAEVMNTATSGRYAAAPFRTPAGGTRSEATPAKPESGGGVLRSFKKFFGGE